MSRLTVDLDELATLLPPSGGTDQVLVVRDGVLGQPDTAGLIGAPAAPAGRIVGQSPGSLG